MKRQNDRIDLTATDYSHEVGLQSQLEKIAERVQTLRQGGKLTPEVLGRLRRYFRIKNIYHSNGIEGNTLNIGETRQVVERGLTITGKPLKDQAEAKNLSEAVDFLEDLAANPESPITETDIRQIHSLILRGIDNENAGKYRSVGVEISGSAFTPPSPESVPAEMQRLGDWLKTAGTSTAGSGRIDGLLNAAVAHTWFVITHPFADGNGRVARLLMNLILMRYGYPIAIIAKEDRLRYYDALEEAQSSDLTAFIGLLIECVHESLEEYEKAAAERDAQREWAQSLANRFTSKERKKAENDYEIWKNAIDLLRGYFRQNAEAIREAAAGGDIRFREFSVLEFDKYFSLRQGESVKKTWFFRIDFHSGAQTARYLFFFGYPSLKLRDETDVTLHVAREEPVGSFTYEKLERLPEARPKLAEIGYSARREQFILRTRQDDVKHEKIEATCRQFFEDVINMHFSS
jgi:Fic family protein